MRKTYKIEVTFGSEFQRLVWADSIELMIQGFGAYMLTKHKGNKINIKVSEKE